MERKRRLDILAFCVWVIALVSVLQWRRNEIFTGAVDPTVAAKAALAIVGLGGAVLLRKLSRERRRLSVFPTFLVLVIVALALLGSQAAGTLGANIVLTVRILLLIVTVLTVLSVTSPGRSVATLLGAMSGIGVFTAAIGAYRMYETSTLSARLSGGIPPLQPNGLAALVLPGAIGLVYVVVSRGVRPLPVVGLILLTGILYETGSRTSLAMLGIGAVVVVICAKRIPRSIVVIGLVSVVAGVAVLSFTDVFQALLLRGQDASQLATLNSRTIAWNVVLNTPTDSWAWWIGNGLSEKTVAVLGQFWTTQVFDSSWISSLAQDGIIGTVLLVVYVLGTLVATARNPEVRGFALAQVVTTVVISFVENGLIESSFTFVMFFTFAVLAWPSTVSVPAGSLGSGRGPAVGVPRAPRILVYPARQVSAPAPHAMPVP